MYSTSVAWVLESVIFVNLNLRTTLLKTLIVYNLVFNLWQALCYMIRNLLYVSFSLFNLLGLH
jgi:hypothetical protein